jgi:hypothetical protein
LFKLGETKTSCSTYCGLTAAHLSEQINLHLEKILSLATDVAGMPKNLQAMAAMFGNIVLFFVHHSRGLISSQTSDFEQNLLSTSDKV